VFAKYFSVFVSNFVFAENVSIFAENVSVFARPEVLKSLNLTNVYLNKKKNNKAKNNRFELTSSRVKIK
jgi:hypothetical protein